MPHRFHISVAESLKFDSWLSRHALTRSSKEKMQQEMPTGSPVSRAKILVPQQDQRISSLNSDFERVLSTSNARTPCPVAHQMTTTAGMPTFFTPAPRYTGPFQQHYYYQHPRMVHGRGFHTTRCYSPQFPNERHQVMQPRETDEEQKMATSVKRSWEDDRRATLSAERNRSKYMPAEEYKRHHRSKSCDGLERNHHQPGFLEGELRADVNRLRRWEYTDFGRDHRIKPKAGMEFTIMTYNVLAQCLLEGNSYLYQHCNPSVLPWEFRKLRILKELEDANADILCLQEIQCDHYEDFFVPKLGNLGYTGHYKKRTGNKNDGCAIFFKDELFALDHCTSVEYSKPGLSLFDRDRDNIALVAMLRSKRGNGGKICVANTHLLFNPGRGDIKLAQLRILLAEIDRFAFHRQSQRSQKPLYHPVILCGDMNSEPNCSLYEFISTGVLRYEGLVAGDISGQADGYRRGRFCLEKELIPEQLGISDQCQYVDTISARIGGGGMGKLSKNARETHDSASAGGSSEEDRRRSMFSTGEMTHRLNFVSAYSHRLGRARGMKDAVTTHHRKSSCMVDYIFYSVHSKDSYVKKIAGGKRVEHRDTKDGSLSLIATYGLLSCEELSHLGGLPNSVLPSDHLTLVARFLLRDDS